MSQLSCGAGSAASPNRPLSKLRWEAAPATALLLLVPHRPQQPARAGVGEVWWSSETPAVAAPLQAP